MTKKYNFKEIEKKWQKVWEDKKLFDVKIDKSKDWFGVHQDIKNIQYGKSYICAIAVKAIKGDIITYNNQDYKVVEILVKDTHIKIFGDSNG